MPTDSLSISTFAEILIKSFNKNDREIINYVDKHVFLNVLLNVYFFRDTIENILNIKARNSKYFPHDHPIHLQANLYIILYINSSSYTSTYIISSIKI